MEFRIGNDTYKLEYNIEASMCEECIEKTTGFLLSVGNAEGQSAIRNLVSTLSDLPSTVLSLFYAGLLEHHGEDGDRTVTSKADAKKLLKSYMKENCDKEEGNYHYLIGAFVEQMEKDGFFKLIGLESIVKNMTDKPQKKAKTPTDHLKPMKN